MRIAMMAAKLAVLAGLSGAFAGVAIGGERPNYGVDRAHVEGVEPGERRQVAPGIYDKPVRKSNGLLSYGRLANGTEISTHGPDPLPDSDDPGDGGGAGDSGDPDLPVTPPCLPTGHFCEEEEPPPLPPVPALQCLPAGQDRFYETLYYVPQGQQGNADLDDLALEVQKAGQLMSDEAFTVGRRYRDFFVKTDADCKPIVERIDGLQGSTSFGSVIGDVAENFGKQDPNRKYIIFVQGGGGCGVASMFDDASKSASNKHNQRTGWALVYPACRDNRGRTVLHEVAHNLSAVQADYPGHPGAPNNNTLGTPANANDVRWHCVDESDRMCYDEPQPAEATQSVCDDGREWFDCNHDDYFNPDPPAGSFLNQKFNMANDSFWITAVDQTDPELVAIHTRNAFPLDHGGQIVENPTDPFRLETTATAADNWAVADIFVQASTRQPWSPICPEDGYEGVSQTLQFIFFGAQQDRVVSRGPFVWGRNVEPGCYRVRAWARDVAGRDSPVVDQIIPVPNPVQTAQDAPTDVTRWTGQTVENLKDFAGL